MKILVLSRSAWRDDNSTGRTLSDIMSAFPDAEINCVSMRDQKMDNNICRENFIISEKQMVKHFLGKGQVGKREKDICYEKTSDNNIYNNEKAKSSTIFWILRELIWSFGGWKNSNLNQYIKDVNPDIIFSPIFPGCYPQKLLLYLKKVSGAKVAVFHMDDNYTLRRYSLSPLFWIYRMIKRRWVKKATKCADVVYVISELQKREYEKSFGRECKLLTKTADFDLKPQFKEMYNKPLELVYTGNIGLNRWKSLSHIANVLEKVNSDGIKAKLKIYTGTYATKEMKAALNRGESSAIVGSISSDKVVEIQREADMLVHVEALDIKNKLIVRQSFSTKIVDYLASARPILAYGPKDVASIDHLISNECAIAADSEEELFAKLSEAVDNADILNSLALKAFECGKKKHNKVDIDNMLKSDMGKLLKQKEGEA